MRKIDFDNRLNSQGEEKNKDLCHERKIVGKNQTNAFVGVDTMGSTMKSTGSGDAMGTAATDTKNQNCTETTSNE